MNRDPRRTVFADPDGVTASNFGGTTIGPGAYGTIKQMLHFIQVPRSWSMLEENGILDMLPVSKSGEPDEEYPAYFITAKHGQSTAILIGSNCYHLQEASAMDDTYKMMIQHYAAPIDRIIKEAKEDWEMYEKKFRDQGQVPADAPYIPYPYTEDYLWEQLEEHKQNRVVKGGVVEQLPPEMAETFKFSEVTLKCASTGETMKVRTRYGHTVAEIQEMLCRKHGLQDPQALEFFDSDGSQSRPLEPLGFVVARMTVRGIATFKQ